MSQGKRVWGFNLYDRCHVRQRPAGKLEPDDLRDYGYTSAPYVHGALVIVEVGAAERTLMAFDRRHGVYVAARAAGRETARTPRAGWSANSFNAICASFPLKW